MTSTVLDDEVVAADAVGASGAAHPAPVTDGGALASLRSHVRAPLFRTAYALIGSTLLTTGLGMGASIAAARLYDVEDVGRGQSAVNALVLLAGLGNLRLMNVLTRFLPRARERSAWLVGRSYLLAVGASLVACAVCLNLPGDPLPVATLLGHAPYAGLWFTGAVVAFALFTLQDAVLTGVRQATWVPIENGVHSLLKLGLVVALAGTLPAAGIFVSWTIPTVLALVPINLLLVRRLLPANARRAVVPEDLSLRRLAPFTAGEYAGSLCELAVANLIPLIVADRLGLEAAGVFGVAWLIGTTLDHVVVHFGASLTVEGASDPDRLAALTRQLLHRSATVIAPVALAVVVGAPLVLRLFGQAYAARAGGLLSLLGLALLPRLVCTVAVVVARVRGDVRTVVGIQALLAAGTLVGSILLLDGMALAGPGVAYLASSVVVAAVVAPWLRSTLYEPRHLAPRNHGLTPVLVPEPSPASLPEVAPASFPEPAPATLSEPGATGAQSLRRASVDAGSFVKAAPLTLSVGLLVLSLLQVDRSDAGGALGLLAVLPPAWWLGLAVLAASFAWSIVRTPHRPVLLGAHLVLLVVALHATPGLIEAHGRFPTAWTHVGFVDHVVETGQVDPGYDARYNWPGAFSLGAFLVDLTGAESARALVRFAPVVVNLLLLAPLMVLVRHVTRDVRVRWVGLWLAVLTNWVGQDYLAPQPLALLGYLVVVGLLLGWFRSDHPRTASAFDLLGVLRRRFGGWVRDDRLGRSVAPPPYARAGQEFGLIVVIVGIGAVLAFSHQLTPFMLVVASVVLVVTGRVDRPLVPLILAVCTAAWVGLGATSYLRSNLADLASALGDLGAVVDDNQSRVGPDHARQLVLATRMVLTLLAGGLATVGFWRQWRARRADWALVGLAVSPVLLAGLNSYGGEVLLRVSLFSLPFLALLGAFALVGERAGPAGARRAGVAVLVASGLLLPLFVAARYGNEAFERIDDDDIAAWDYLVDHAPAGATVVVTDFAGPWRYRALTRFEYKVFADEADDDLSARALDDLVTSEDGPTYVVLGTASAQFHEIAEGYPPGWSGDLSDDLLDSGDYSVVFTAGTTRVLRHSPGSDT